MTQKLTKAASLILAEATIDVNNGIYVIVSKGTVLQEDYKNSAGINIMPDLSLKHQETLQEYITVRDLFREGGIRKILGEYNNSFLPNIITKEFRTCEDGKLIKKYMEKHGLFVDHIAPRHESGLCITSEGYKIRSDGYVCKIKVAGIGESLKSWLPEGAHISDRIKHLLDQKIIKEYGYGIQMREWPGEQAYVSRWCLLSNGYAVAYNEHPVDGCSFHSMKIV